MIQQGTVFFLILVIFKQYCNILFHIGIYIFMFYLWLYLVKNSLMSFDIQLAKHFLFGYYGLYQIINI